MAQSRYPNNKQIPAENPAAVVEPKISEPVKEEAISEPVKKASEPVVGTTQKSVNLVAVTRKIRCPMSGIIYNTSVETAVGVVDIDSPEKAWEKNQLKAGILREV